MEKNRKAPARHKAKEDMYLLTTKLCCGKCGTFMVGESGTSRNGTFHQYYKCANVKNKKGCDKKTVRKKFIEDAVISQTAKLLMDDKFIENLVEIIYEHHGKESTIIPQIKKQLAENSKSIDNILNAMEQGIITSSTKERLEKLEQSRSNLEISLAKEQMKKPEINKNQLKYWLLQFRKLDLEVPEQRQLLVDNFVNAIYLYDDKIVLTFNYKGDTATVTLDEIKCSDIGELTAA